MKLSYKLLIALGVLAFCGHSVQAQSSATTTGCVGGKIVFPLSLTWDQPLAFGTFTSPSSASTMDISVVGVGTLTNGHMVDVNPSNLTGTVATVNTAQTASFNGDPPGPAVFEASGQMGFTYAITLPTAGIPLSPSITLNNHGSDPMYLTNFVSSVGLTGLLDPVTGNQWFAIGATLNINANQVTGQYTGQFPVSVNYN